MKPLPKLILLAFCALAAPTANLSKLSEELLTEGLISLDESGVPTTVCVTSNTVESSRIDDCRITDGFGARSVGCFVVWNGTEVLRRGCYSNQEISLRAQCVRDSCSAGKKEREGITFCCCHGALCNA